MWKVWIHPLSGDGKGAGMSKARFFKGDRVYRADSFKIYKVEEIVHDSEGRRIIIAFPEDRKGSGIKFYDSDKSYILQR